MTPKRDPKRTYTYDAFGNLIEQWHDYDIVTPNNYLYCGEQFDTDLGLYFLRARYLHTDSGRFWTLDTWEGQPGDPLSLQKYLYAHNDPANRVDPSGNASLSELLSSTAVRVTLLSVVLVSIPTTAHVVSRFRGTVPNTSQQAKIDAAIAILRSGETPVQFKDYVAELNKARFRIVKSPQKYLARNAPWILFENIIWIPDTSLRFDDRFVAAMLLHESVHLEKGQFIKGEEDAYQVESDFLKALKITGEAEELIKTKSNSWDAYYILNASESFKNHDVKAPAFW